MFTFSQFIYLFEAKLEDIKRGIANRHKAETGEDINPDELHDVVTKAKKIPGVDLTKSSYRELKDKVDPGIKEIYHDHRTEVTINHVTRKDTCTREYGHGVTNWCVSATGKGNLFDDYGKGGKRFFTVHHENPNTGEEYILGMHEHEKGTIRDSRNNEAYSTTDIHPDVLKAMAKTPELAKINIMSNNPHFKPTEEQFSQNIDAALDSKNPETVKKAVHHPNASIDKLKEISEKHPVSKVRIQAKIALEKRKG